MAMDLTGIKNQNEYYTNHYFSSIFEENAADTISVWRNSAKEEGEQTPWAKFRDTAKQYYRIRERYLHTKNEDNSKVMVEELAGLYIKALGYETLNSVMAAVVDGVQIPVFHEEVKNNGAPFLWVVLSVANEKNEDILQGHIFKCGESEEATYVALEDNNDSVLGKMFFAGEEAPRWVVVIGINQIALIDRNKWNEKRFLQFDLDEIFSRHEETTFQALTVLLHKESLCPSDGISLLDNLDENSHKHSAGVSDALKYALRECIELLGNEVIYDMKTRQGIDLEENPVDARELTIECLRYMYRVLFMLFIEARPELGYAPMKSQAYVQGYSLEGLRDVCEKVREESESVLEGYYLDDTLSELFRLVYEGYPGNLVEYKKAIELESSHDIFTIEALKAHIFDPEYTKMITNARLRNTVMLQIIDLMSISRPGNSRERRGRISYSALGINQMGAVYEALLSYRGFLAEETLFEVKRAGDKFNELDVGYFVPERELDNYTEDERVRYEKGDKKGQLRKYEKGTFIYRLAGREREKSASYYTPEVLTKCLVKYALKELLKDKTADEILHLTVCEPAMGSAAFLNEAINQLAEAYLNKKQEELGETIPFDKRFEELQKVKMFIADRNVYGVDLNPIAVELAEVSLWLNTIYKGAYVPWFGTQLMCGNSLIGARRQVYPIAKIEAGKWYDEAPVRLMPGEKRVRVGARSRVYHFLLGEPGMANYTDKVIKGLEPDNIEIIKKWNKEFTKKWDDADTQTLLRLCEIIDVLWDKTVELQKRVGSATANHLNVYGYEESDKSAHASIREKDEIYHKIYRSEGGENASPYARLKAAMDYWCALWFWPIDKADLLPSRQEFLFDMDLVLEGGFQTVSTTQSLGQMVLDTDSEGNMVFVTQGTQMELQLRDTYDDLGVVCLDALRERNERLKIANEIAEQQRFMHWELEFADLFEERGGFDLIVGNPPWIKYDWNEQNVLADTEPAFAIKMFNAAQISKKRMDELSNQLIRANYLKEYSNICGIQNFINAISNYELLNGQQTNLYKPFIPLVWEIAAANGVMALIHPDGVYDDPKGGNLRSEIYKRLVFHFQFRNELKLFADVHHSRVYSLNVYKNGKNKIIFDSINNLYAANTIDESYMLEFGDDFGVKDKCGNWNIRGCKQRIVTYTDIELKAIARLFGETKWEHVQLLNVQIQEMLSILKNVSEIRNNIGSLSDSMYVSEMWNETNAQKEGLIEISHSYPEIPLQVILSGANIGLSNPLFKTARMNCEKNSDYDVINMEEIRGDYLPRGKYQPSQIQEYKRSIPMTTWESRYDTHYRIFARKMIDPEGYRTLLSAIFPPGMGHTHGVTGFAMKSNKDLIYVMGMFSSLPYDYLVKATAKANFQVGTASTLPMIEKDIPEFYPIVLRVLVLNCVTSYYTELWKECFDYSFIRDSWAKRNDILDHHMFDLLTEQWNFDYVIKDDYSRRQALVEIDVLIARALRLTLEQLLMIYRIQFPVLQSQEKNTWYDANGKIVYTNNRSIQGVGVSSGVWAEIKDMSQGVYEYETDQGYIIKYQAPYVCCDREKDYEEVWATFEERFKTL